jgi:hypothetical protein
MERFGFTHQSLSDMRSCQKYKLYKIYELYFTIRTETFGIYLKLYIAQDFILYKDLISSTAENGVRKINNKHRHQL